MPKKAKAVQLCTNMTWPLTQHPPIIRHMLGSRGFCSQSHPYCSMQATASWQTDLVAYQVESQSDLHEPRRIDDTRNIVIVWHSHERLRQSQLQMAHNGPFAWNSPHMQVCAWTSLPSASMLRGALRSSMHDSRCCTFTIMLYSTGLKLIRLSAESCWWIHHKLSIAQICACVGRAKSDDPQVTTDHTSAVFLCVFPVRMQSVWGRKTLYR